MIICTRVFPGNHAQFEYVQVNKAYEVATLIPEFQLVSIAEAINALLTNTVLYERLKLNCLGRKKRCITGKMKKRNWLGLQELIAATLRK